MNKYDLVFITKIVQSEAKENLLKQVADLILKHNGKVINQQIWFEKQKFAFDIKGQKEGTYHLIQFTIDSLELSKLKSALQLNENILRFMIIKQKF